VEIILRREMNEFKTFHPIVGFIYFFVVIAFSMMLMHPICLVITLLCSVVYSGLLKKNMLISAFVIVILSMVFNPLFNHRGVTVLAYFPNGNPMTMETLAYGCAAGAMLASVICWFSCFNKVITSDKIIYLFGKIMPSLSLVVSMVLRFVPRFKEQLRVISVAQRCIGADITNGNIIKRTKNGMSIFSVLVTWALENSVDTADSMKSRGYGLPGRTAFSIYVFDRRDFVVLLIVVFLSTYVLLGYLCGSFDFIYYPYIKCSDTSFYSVSVFFAYLCLCGLPVIIELLEELKWKYLISKI